MRRPVREITLEAQGVTLSGLLAVPDTRSPDAVLVALHGGGMRAGYFHGQADPRLSLLTLAAERGYAVLALDRPGYGASADALPEGLELAGQSAVVRAALAGFARTQPTGAGFFLLGHSLGGKLALTTAADWAGGGLMGVDVSGISDRWAVDPRLLTSARDRGLTHRLHWGPLALYPPDTFRLAAPLVAPMPSREAREVPSWPDAYPAVACRVRVPVRLTFAEHERWWRCDSATVEAMAARLAAPLVRVDRLADAGHNISLGRTAPLYHHDVLAFLEQCRIRNEQQRPARAR
ncbi:alpha/beta hydrolase [Streptomyces hygroscopicus]|uniref:alpha/beta hydrolase n=1 Tax=Streptomyces hygroscopicus TaxID=1912 RepID=UPI001FCAF680|nr:alpha/beta fold hydrolase [Streptomyces hygroscopicus]BDH13420.1 thioesterase [Streptomyces hygroscopicus]